MWIPCTQATSLLITLISIASLILEAFGHFLLEMMKTGQKRVQLRKVIEVPRG
jgi:hypothetical protein